MLAKNELYPPKMKLSLLVALNFGFKKKRDCVIHVAKTMEMISCAFTAKLIFAFVYAYASCLFYDVVAKMNITSQVTIRHQSVTCTSNPARTSEIAMDTLPSLCKRIRLPRCLHYNLTVRPWSYCFVRWRPYCFVFILSMFKMNASLLRSWRSHGVCWTCLCVAKA